MNLDEFLRSQETMSDLEIFDGESYRGVSRKKLLALVRKLREQRDAGRLLNIDLEEWQEMKAEFNAALDEIVRGG